MNKIILLILLVIATNTVFANEKPNKNINKDSFTLISELKEVKELFDTGVIDEKEFKLIKQKLINKLYGLNLDSDNNSKTNESVVSTDDESLTSDEPKLKYWGKKYYQKAKEFYDNKDYENAYKWYRKAAEQGDVNAQFSLATLYDYGEGVTQDYKEAAKWYRKAAEQGDDGAQYNLGVMYDQGDGVTQDDKVAVKWYRKAAELGHQRAKTRLKGLISKGETIKKISNKKVVMSCNGDLWDFGIGGSSNSQEPYWEDIVIKGDTLIAPKFGEYRKLGTQDGERFWRMSTGDPKRNWAKLNINNNEFTISVKKGGVTKQMVGKCSKKSNN
jgi:tetratricopeptide (TPR) repeat protein